MELPRKGEGNNPYFACSSALGVCGRCMVPYRKRNIKSLEKFQRQAASFSNSDYSRELGTVTKLLSDLKWETLETRRLIHRLSLMYKIRHELVEIPMSQHLVHNTRLSRLHNQKYNRPATRVGAYKNNFSCINQRME